MTLSILGLAGLLGWTSPAAIPQASPMEARLQAKLQEPWLKKAAWITDYDDAKAASKEQGKPIFAYFTRSYAP